MRLHEVLEATIEYVAIDGVLGSDPRTLQQHLQTLDKGIDEEFFDHIWACLIDHPLLQFIISSYPIPNSDGTVNLGTAPLPADYGVDPADAFTRGDPISRDGDLTGLKGRALAYALEGKEYKTDKETIIENRKLKREKAKEVRQQRNQHNVAGKTKGKRGKSEGVDGASIADDEVQGELAFRVIGADDGGDGEDRVLKSDLRRLYAKWGSRLRVRATDDEIYYRLTGSHQRIGKLTPIVFHALQLSARSREKGMTALELAPAIGSSQGSMFHYMKTLVQLGLCVKVPAVMHSTITNLLIYHRFIHLNPHYRASARLPPLSEESTLPTGMPAAVEPPAPIAPVTTTGSVAEDEEGDEEEDDESISKQDSLLNLNFGPITEEQLMAGHIVRERLLKMLEHPGLKNHLLRRKNLLPLVGWQSRHVLRHRRAIPRVIDALVHEGIVEVLAVGEKQIRCLRLTAYNPDFVPPQPKAKSIAVIEDGPHAMDDDALVAENSAPYIHQSTASLAQHLDYQINRLIELSGEKGMTIADLRRALDGYYKRTIEFHFKRSEDGWVPPHLRNRQIVHSMDTQGKERRLKALSLAAFRQYMEDNHQPVDESKHPALTNEIGHWGSLAYRALWSNPAEIDALLAALSAGDDRLASNFKPKGRPKKRKRSVERADTGDDANANLSDDQEAQNKPVVRQMKYNNTAQSRGRPRKYIYVVDLKGDVDRRVIGQVRPHPDLAPIYVWVPHLNKLCPAPPGYDGKGPPPPLDEEAIEQGKPPEYFKNFSGLAREGVDHGLQQEDKKMTAKERKKFEQERKKQEKEKKKAQVLAEKAVKKEESRRKKAKLSGDAAQEVADEAPSITEDADMVDATPVETVLAPEGSRDEAPVAPVDVSEEASGLSSAQARTGPSWATEPRKRGRPSKNTFLYPPASLSHPSLAQSVPPGPSALSPKSVSPTSPDLLKQVAAEPAGPEVQSGSTTTLLPRRNHPMFSTGPAPSVAQETVGDVVNETPSKQSATTDKRSRSPGQPAAPASTDSGPAVISGTESGSRAKKARKSNAKSANQEREAATTEKPVQATPDKLDSSLRSQVHTPLQQDASISSKPTPSLPVKALREDTPLFEITHEQDSGELELAGTRSRPDMGTIRRMNELYYALKDEAGGICDLGGFSHVQYAYAKRVAGTDAPGANKVATQMDRLIIHRHVKSLVEEGRIKQSTVHVATNTGKQRTVTLIYIPDIDKNSFNQFVLGISERLASVYTPKRPIKKHIAATEFTEVQVPAATNDSRPGSRPSLRKSASSSTNHAEVAQIAPELRRATLLGDPTVVHALYGYHSGPNARVATMHQAILKAFATCHDPGSVVSEHPRVFSIDMLFNEISISEWLQCVSYIRYSEKLEAYVKDPLTKHTKIRDVPPEVLSRGAFRGHVSKSKLNNLLSGMADLKLLAPLVTVDMAQAELVCTNSDGVKIGFNTTDSFLRGMYFRLYDFAPVYHIAADALGMLGILPVRTPDEAEKFWDIAKAACLEVDINAIPSIDRNVLTDPSLHAPLADHLSFHNIDKIKMLRAHIRWKAAVRLSDVQRQAIEELFDKKDGALLVSNEAELQQFSYEWATPLDTLKEYLATRLGRINVQQRVKLQREKEVKARAAAAERRRAAEKEFEDKLREIRAAGKLEFEKKVKAAAERTNTPYSPELETFLVVSLHSLRSGSLTDDQMDSSCRMFVRNQLVGSYAPPGEGLPAAKLTSNPLARKATNRKPQPVNAAAAKARRHQPKPLTRRRRAWTEADDAKLLYAEAVIRARYKGNGQGKRSGRHALAKVFSDVSNQVALNRLKKLWERPGKRAFYERLIDTFLDLWRKHRGTAILPDDDPSNLSDFDINAHIAFLMDRVPPDGLRNLGDEMVPDEVKIEDLPMDYESIVSKQTWEPVPTFVPSWNTVWELNHDELRDTTLSSIPLVHAPVPPVASGASNVEKGKLKALLKSATGTAAIDYHESVAFRLIENSSAKVIRSVTEELQAEKVIRKWRGASGGRIFQLNQPWINAGDGIFSEELLSEADAVRTRFEHAESEDMKIQWPLTGPEGEIASLLNMVSNHQVEFEIDAETFPTIKYHRDSYNTRKLNDIDFEFPFSVQRTVPFDEKPPLPEPPSLSEPSKPVQWVVEPLSDSSIVDKALSIIKADGPEGLTKDALQDILKLDRDSTMALLASLAHREVFWAGYDTARIVHRDHWKNWAFFYREPLRDETGQVIGSHEFSGKFASPRIWTDIFGHRVEVLWEKAKRNVLGYIIARPGLSERTLRNKIGTTLDRLEVNDVLQWLLDSRSVERKSMIDSVLPPVEALDVDEEEDVAWYPVSKVLWQ